MQEMSFLVVSRAWRGEIPYIRSWVDYYLNFLGFNKVLIIRCDAERFSFLGEFGSKVDFLDCPANNESTLLGALLDNGIHRDFAYTLSCDIDEYLILHGDRVQDFVGKTQADCYFFPWALCCNTEYGVCDLRQNFSQGCSVGNNGKTMFRNNNAIRMISEHKVQMTNGCKHMNIPPNFHQKPYILHFSSRGLEDVVIRGMWQGIKVEKTKEKYISCLENPPKKFKHLPFRYKVAYFQKRLEKVSVRAEVPPLLVDFPKLQSMFEETGATKHSYLFDIKYEIEQILDAYPHINFYQVSQFSEPPMIF